MRFDDIFKLEESTCGGLLLQPFFGVFGTFISSLSGAFALRSGIDIITRIISRRVTNDVPTQALPGFRPGQFEFHILKTAYLGLCQAAGAVIAVAINQECSGGWLKPAIWCMAISWLLCVPVGLIVFIFCRLFKALKRKDILFKKANGNGSWSAYFQTIHAAKGTAEEFCKPTVTHAIFKVIFAIATALCSVLGLRSATAKDPTASPIFFSVGAISLFIATQMSSKVGRSVIVSITNIPARSIGKVFVIVESGAVEERDLSTCSKGSKVSKLTKSVLGSLGTLQAKMFAATNPKIIKALSNQGRWKKKDSLSMFYGNFNQRGIYFSVFLMAKNLFLGVLLTTEPVAIVRPIAKVFQV
jgi:hypothetical protein